MLHKKIPKEKLEYLFEPYEIEAYKRSLAKWKYEDKVINFFKDEENNSACRHVLAFEESALPIPKSWNEFQNGKHAALYSDCNLKWNTCTSFPRLTNLIKLINDVFYYSTQIKE